MSRGAGRVGAVALALSIALVSTAHAQASNVVAAASTSVDSARAAARPFVAGGYDDKPHLRGLFGRIAVGGYVEALYGWERADGVTEEAGFELRRWNLLTSSRVSERVQVWAEVEFEDGGEEIILELAQLDFELHPAFNVRGGMLLLPLGRFNLAHDGPRNAFTDRPLLATDLLGSALSMPGLGLFGLFEIGGEGRATYEAYAVNGFTDAILLDSPDGTRLAAGRRNAEDNNASPALVSRLAWSLDPRRELGISGFTGAYNTFRLDGLDVDERRSVRAAVLDLRTPLLGLEWNAEVAAVSIDVPAGLAGLFASRQGGFFVEASRPFGRALVRTLPSSYLAAGVRLEGIDLDRDLEGDSTIQLTSGLRFHPTPESVLKLDYLRSRARDRFNNAAEGAALRFSMTSYF
ncbi:MAG: hypothetical protein HOP12_01495 [Candidatus Eisenbacteria bacterium]|uniref:Porin n=1 Tax=Eiseniibacteriota bacterium TaxID=2212470 RepID=A0A849SBS8_UNCEI|nr:hypothetical protein [Candidatus Eisenbacteria bacterium]